MRIFKLDKEVISKIAAGEVIENPASVVKELLENSIDASGKKIEIELANSGKKLIRVRDDGEGIAYEDLAISVERHTTSKLFSIEDLENISTLGFRGEALSSISSVSRMRIVSRKEEEELGGELFIHGGDMKRSERIGCNRGTIIEAEDLFYNIPVRRKHLRTDQAELDPIVKLVMAYILSKPEISFKLWNNGKEVLFSQSTSDIAKNASFVLDPSSARNLIELNHEGNGIRVNGFIVKPTINLRNSSRQFIFVNGRWVADKGVTEAVYVAMHTLLPVGRHPIFSIKLMVSPEILDQNIHPQKKRVSFERRADVEEAVKNAVFHSLQGKELFPEATSFPSQLPLANFVPVKETQSHIKNEEVRWRILGQVKSTYAIVDSEEGLLIVDQHAAMERVNYERLMKGFTNKDIDVQNLIQPELIEMSPQDYEFVMQTIEYFRNSGFSLEGFGQNTLVVRGYPVVLGRNFGRKEFMDMLYELRENREELFRLKEEYLIRKACRASVKKNEKLEISELYDLLSLLFSCEQPNTCPHGRPTIVRLREEELEKMFKRRM